MIVELPRRWRWAIGAGCALVLLLTLVLIRTAAPGTAEPVASVDVTEPELSTTARGISTVADAATVDATPSQARASRGADEVQLCGGAWVRTTADGIVDHDDLQRVARVPEARSGLIATLQAQSGDFERATALWLEMVGSDSTRLAMSMSHAAPCDSPECKVAPEAAARFAQGRDALARMASATRDPRVYALALNTCGLERKPDGACRLVSPEQWARLEPDNATPWLIVLQQANARRDRAAQEEALFRVSVAKRSDQHFYEPLGLVLDRLPDDDASMPTAAALAIETVSAQAAWELPGYVGLNAMCKGAALRDANRRQVCTAVAELLVDRGDTLLERGNGVALGRGLGWSEDRIAQARGEHAAYVASLAEASASNLLSCTAMRRDLDRLRQQARRGEAGAFREWLAQSGRKPADFVQAQRQAEVRAAAAAASATSAASAASAAG